jgi:hypothetical protein
LVSIVNVTLTIIIKVTKQVQNDIFQINIVLVIVVIMECAIFQLAHACVTKGILEKVVKVFSVLKIIILIKIKKNYLQLNYALVYVTDRVFVIMQLEFVYVKKDTMEICVNVRKIM